MSKNIFHRPVAELDISELRELDGCRNPHTAQHLRYGFTHAELVERLKAAGTEWVLRTPSGYLLPFTEHKTIETEKGPIECLQEAPYRSTEYGTRRSGLFVECAAYCPRTGRMTSFGFKLGKDSQPIADAFLGDFIKSLPNI